MTLMLSPLANKTFVTSAGVVYVADTNAVIANVATPADVADLVTAGCAVLQPPPTDLLFTLKSANMNSTADQILIPTFQGKFRIKRIVITNASISLDTAAGGFYPAASKGGTAVVAAGQVYSALTAATKALEATLNNASAVLAAGTSIYLSLTTGQGAAAIADVYVYGDVYV
jgi:hypothetical protein